MTWTIGARGARDAVRLAVEGSMHPAAIDPEHRALLERPELDAEITQHALARAMILRELARCPDDALVSVSASGYVEGQRQLLVAVSSD